MIFTVLPVEYSPTADPGLMERTVLTAMADEGMARFMQKLLGYGITGEVREEIFVVFTAGGRHGKGVLTQTLQHVLGPFYKSMNTGLICERQVSNIDAERGKLLGARIAVFDELKHGERLKTHEVQLLSGGDGIPARPLYSDPVTIVPHHLCILSTNHMPQLSEVIPAIVERLVCINFPVTFVDLLPGEEPTRFRRQKDAGAKRALEADRQGVLKWLVNGAVAWYAMSAQGQSLKKCAPPQVTEFSRQYFDEQDRLAAFLKERCQLGDGLTVRTAELLAAYNEGLDREAKVDERWLAAAMRTKGFEKKKVRTQCFVGLSLLPNPTMENSDADPFEPLPS